MTGRLVTVCLIVGSVNLHSAAADPLQEVVAGAKTFLSTLDEQQRAQTVLPFNSDERLNWHYVPKDRLGLPYKNMNTSQRESALSLMMTLLSQEGFQTVETIRSLEDVLKVMENDQVGRRDPDKYYFTVFGQPSETENWGIRFEGHHISLHWTIVHGKIVSTFPQFLGSNPGEVKDGPKKGTRPLAAEEDLGRSLVKSLDEKQRVDAVLQQEVPADIITGASREAAIEGNLGLPYAAMSPDQQGVLISLVQVLANIQRPEFAETHLARLRDAGLENITFAWIGGFEKGEKHYYRVQGPTFVIEYDNTQNDANHIHVVWRDFKGDFGQDALKEHYTAHAGAEHPGEHKH